jgi:hypothetical protein
MTIKIKLQYYRIWLISNTRHMGDEKLKKVPKLRPSSITTSRIKIVGYIYRATQNLKF